MFKIFFIVILFNFNLFSSESSSNENSFYKDLNLQISKYLNEFNPNEEVSIRNYKSKLLNDLYSFYLIKNIPDKKYARLVNEINLNQNKFLDITNAVALSSINSQLDTIALEYFFLKENILKNSNFQLKR